MSDPRLLIDESDAALILSLSPGDVRKMVRNDQIPYRRLPCGATRFELRALVEWVSRLAPQTELKTA
jgi:hypothetical protein